MSILATWSSTTRLPRTRRSPNGIPAKATRAKKTEKKGARVWRTLSAPAGIMSSLVNILTASAMGWNSPIARNPKMLARLAPILSWRSRPCDNLRQIQRRSLSPDLFEAQAGEGSQCFGQPQEDLLGIAPGQRVIQLPGDFQEKTPVFPGVRERREGPTYALDSIVAVHKGSVLFHIRCG